MMNEPAYWIHDPVITINLNVSWGHHTPIWLLERIPEVYDLAELNGAPQADVAYWREHTLKNSLNFLDIIQTPDENGRFQNFDFIRYVRRNAKNENFKKYIKDIQKSYSHAWEANIPFATVSDQEFKQFIETKLAS